MFEIVDIMVCWNLLCEFTFLDVVSLKVLLVFVLCASQLFMNSSTLTIFIMYVSLLSIDDIEAVEDTVMFLGIEFKGWNISSLEVFDDKVSESSVE